MTTIYLYRDRHYSTESEAQAALSAIKSRLDNNPTDWCSVKVIETNDDGSYTVLPDTLNDLEIRYPDSTRTYSFWSTYTGLNFFPLTSEQLQEKVAEYRRAYVASERLAAIYSYDEETLGLVLPPEDGVTIPEEPIEFEYTEVPTNEDMSGYI